MSRRENLSARFGPNMYFALFTAFLVVLWVAGGASRADVLGQVVTRGAAWSVVGVIILFAPRPQWRRATPVALFLLAATTLVLLQLIPIPPSLWLELPGRDPLGQSALVSGQEQPWRPLSLSPEATVNALSSLIVPVVTLILLVGLTRIGQWRVAALLLGLVFASSVIGVLQFSGYHFDNPLINDQAGDVSASFANRNHFALFAAIGCLLAPVWAFYEAPHPRWKSFAALALLLLFTLTILATGSRAGLVLAVTGIALGLLIVRRRIGAELARFPKKTAIFLATAAAALVVASVGLSVTLNRAVSVDRAFSLESGEDLRGKALPTVIEMVGKYFPVGSGFGTFDAMYRIEESSALLSPSYFNHAHNDLLEIVLDGGLPGLLLLGSAISWWLWKSLQAWRDNSRSQSLLPRLGSGILLLVLIASAPDYPARTPMIMAVIVIAAVWLNGFGWSKAGPARAPAKADR